LAATIALYDGAQIHVFGHPSDLQLASAAACAMLAQGWTTSRSSSSVRWFFVALLAATAVLSFAGFTLLAWGVDGALLMLPLSLVLAAIASWVAGSTHLRILAHERAGQRTRRARRGPRMIAGVLGGVLLIQAVVILVGYSRFTPALVFPLILIAIAFPPLYLAAVGRDFLMKTGPMR
jgi:predicted small integral membrane protein